MNMKITIIKNSKLDKMKGLRKNFYIFLRYLYYKYVKKISNPKVYHYNFDGIATTHNCDFMKNDNFVRSYSRAKKVFDFEFEMPFRAHQVIWAARNAFRLDGDFIEFGTAHGFMMTCILENIKEWDYSDKKIWLFDTFTKSKDKSVSKFYSDDINQVRKNFSEWKNVNIIQGKLPETLIKSEDIKKISFVHVDLNSPEVEYECLKLIWTKIVDGGIILFDDYAFKGFEKTYKLMNKFAKEKNRMILTTPSGQGILIK